MPVIGDHKWEPPLDQFNTINCVVYCLEASLLSELLLVVGRCTVVGLAWLPDLHQQVENELE